MIPRSFRLLCSDSTGADQLRMIGDVARRKHTERVAGYLAMRPVAHTKV